MFGKVIALCQAAELRGAAKVSLALAILMLTPGCSAPRVEFPIGLYGVERAAFSEIRAAGFDLITGPPEKEFLDEAARAGLKVLVSSGGGSARTNITARERIRRLDAHPAVWAWYLVDEPDLQQIPPREVALANRALQRIARKPTFVVVMSGSAAAHYGDACDLLGVDFYPVPWAPVSQYGKELKLARFQRGARPYYAILQAFDWAAFPHLLETEVPLRAPTREELRCMVYMAAAQRASGLFFYSYRTEGWNLPGHPLWEQVQEIVAEVNRRRPIFTAEHLWWSPKLDYLEGGDSMHNEVREARIMLSRLKVTHGNADTPAGEYVLAINTTPNKVPFRLQLPTQARSVSLLGKSTEVDLDHSVLRKDFEPYEVVICGPLQFLN